MDDKKMAHIVAFFLSPSCFLFAGVVIIIPSFFYFNYTGYLGILKVGKLCPPKFLDCLLPNPPLRI
jgi:hypothetical protein